MEEHTTDCLVLCVPESGERSVCLNMDVSGTTHCSSAERKVAMFLVVYDDEAGLCVPMSWNTDCEGALFGSRRLAQRAITISKNFAKLQESQGKPANTDFLSERRFLKVVPPREWAVT